MRGRGKSGDPQMETGYYRLRLVSPFVFQVLSNARLFLENLLK